MNIFDMKPITDMELKERLLEIDYPNDDGLLGDVVLKIRSFGDEARQMFETWWATAKITNFDIDGITPAWLREFHNMKDIAIIIAYDWLLKEPKEAKRLLKKPLITRK